jgi:hypothetical protein
VTAKALKQVSDRFSLFNDGRKLSANKRNYIIKAVQAMINSPRTQELLRLGEAYGYYGHQSRQRANKLSIGETEVIMINGRPVVVENVPSNRTISITCSDDGIVEHTQEFLDTDTGRIALGLYNSRAGGWSWATGGQDTREASITTSYHGMDYVLQPNYISLDHPAMMMESANSEQMILESLQEQGFDEESARNIYANMTQQSNVELVGDLTNQLMYLESVNAELREKVEQNAKATSMLLDVVDSLPIYVTDAQRKAIANMASKEDHQVVRAMFESLGSRKMATLPTNSYVPVEQKVSVAPQIKQQFVNFGSSLRKFQ